MKLPKVAAVLAAAVLAPAVLFRSSAADTPQPAGVSGPDTATGTPDTTDQEKHDRAEIQAILADKDTGSGVREAAEKALTGGAAELRHFLEAELPEQRADDNRVKVSRIVATGGPAVRAAAKAALKGTDADIAAFLTEGWAKARAQDEADADREPARDRTPDPRSDAKPDARRAVQPQSGQGQGVQPAAVTAATTGTASARPGQLAATGAAVAAGAALVAVSRRRRSAEG